VTAADRIHAVAQAARDTGDRLPAARRAALDELGGAPGGRSLLHRLFDWVLSWLNQLGPLAPGGSVIAGLVKLAILLGLVVLAAYVLVKLAGLVRSRRAPVPHRSHRQSAHELRFGDARARAAELARTDPREALRLLYSTLLHELGVRRGWRPPPGRSNWSFVRRLGARSEQGAALAEATRLFEGRVYGSLRATEGDVRRVDELVDVVLS
jgi:Domain of unknown function (DUF4129)